MAWLLCWILQFITPRLGPAFPSSKWRRWNCQLGDELSVTEKKVLMDYGSHSNEGSACKVHLRTGQYRRNISCAFNLLFPLSAIRVYNFPFPLVVLHTVLHAGVFLSSLYHLVYYTSFTPSEAVCPPLG